MNVKNKIKLLWMRVKEFCRCLNDHPIFNTIIGLSAILAVIIAIYSCSDTQNAKNDPAPSSLNIENEELNSSQSLKFNVCTIPEGAKWCRPLSDGSIVQSNEQFQIRFSNTKDEHCYIFQIGSDNKQVSLFFPQGRYKDSQRSYTNPVETNKEYILPRRQKEKNSAETYKFDDKSGYETFYFICSDTPLDTLKYAFEEINTNNSPKTHDIRLQVAQTDSAIYVNKLLNLIDNIKEGCKGCVQSLDIIHQ